ncbi:hypothetical protein TRVL_01527 [Trypanosoma vivax]|uniref:Uncharacterized protein n=1 Tax=Trypanosoma vivax (strain Y486) TaxID=1055687 RepID=G0U6R9_TRYVY|nr:hypothetical protein TRVL_01527 [Trypanosoma vivax]CCC51573.1 hypothetical protein TVY486_1006230 [Trypanosoma vivax Y486]
MVSACSPTTRCRRCGQHCCGVLLDDCNRSAVMGPCSFILSFLSHCHHAVFLTRSHFYTLQLPAQSLLHSNTHFVCSHLRSSARRWRLVSPCAFPFVFHVYTCGEGAR